MLKKVIYNILFWSWNLPQTLIGFFIVWLFDLQKEKCPFDGISLYNAGGYFSGVSLGKYIILSNCSITNIQHEYGHTVQGFIFGPLYLILIGIPSAYRNIRARFDPKFAKNYYKGFPEAWADAIGGVVRK